MKTIKVLSIILCLLFSGCYDLFGPVQSDQKYLFDVYYVNNAWGFVLSGLYIDKRGDVYSYSISPGDHVSPDSVRMLQRHGLILKEHDLDLKYSFNRKFIKNIDISLVSQKLAELYRVPLNAYSDTLGTGADMGAFVHSGYLFDDQNKTYGEVELKVTGDFSYHNTSRIASALVSWLDFQLSSPEVKNVNK